MRLARGRCADDAIRPVWNLQLLRLDRAGDTDASSCLGSSIRGISADPPLTRYTPPVEPVLMRHSHLFVVGMHRSGTSMITRLLSLMGFYLGDPSEMLPPGPDNVTGFWERRDVLAVNDSLLSLNRCRWDQVDEWGLAPQVTVPPAVSGRIADILESLVQSPLSAMKDPRFCLTLGYWLPFAASPLILVVYRNPLDAAASLSARNGMSLAQSLSLWESYSASLLAVTDGHNRLAVSYESALADPLRFVRELQSSLARRNGNGLSSPPDGSILDFVRQDGRRSTHPRDWPLVLTERQLALANAVARCSSPDWL